MDEKIEEMAMIALKNTMSYTCAKQIAMNFYNAGYRKESDTAREILGEVSKHYGGAWLVELYKKYGVDLGE